MLNLENLEDFLGEEVVDFEGNPIGNFACYWECDLNGALLLGVDVPDRSGRTHVVPARGVRWNERQSYLQVPFRREKVIQAPCLECGCEVDDVFEDRIYELFETSPSSTSAHQQATIKRTQLRRVARVHPSIEQCVTPPDSGKAN